jgi:glycosyltransferase involved in cell wall biosynthesis
MQKIAFITRCTRPDNLCKIAESLKLYKPLGHEWHVIIDGNVVPKIDEYTKQILNANATSWEIKNSESGTYGYDLVNFVADNLDRDLWINLLDDDNLPNPKVFTWFSDNPTILNSSYVIVFGQEVGGKDFTGLDIREAKPENMRLQGVDAAQIFINNYFLQTKGGWAMGYCGDGIFIERVYTEEPTLFHLSPEVLTYYNKLELLKAKRGSSPRVLYVGELPKTKQTGGNLYEYESDELLIQHIENDNEISKIIYSFNPDVIISRSKDWREFPSLSQMPIEIRKKWLHFSNEKDENNGTEIYHAANHTILNRDTDLASVFTSAYNTGEKIYKTYESLKNQTYSNWEWVIVNDSTDLTMEDLLEGISKNDPRVKVYSFSKKTGGIIGEAKYRAAMLCDGEYLMELDHDDYLLPDAVELMVKAFTEYPDAGYAYSDWVECDTDLNSMCYGNDFAFGYGSYYKQTHNNKELDVCACSPVNPKTIRHIVGIPNHFRAWRRSTYHALGGHNRRLTIADDYEITVRAFLMTRFVRIPKCCYLQIYDGNNTQNSDSGRTRKDIQRRVRSIAEKYNEDIKNRFNEVGMMDWAYEFNPAYPLLAPSQFDSGDFAYTLKI